MTRSYTIIITFEETSKNSNFIWWNFILWKKISTKKYPSFYENYFLIIYYTMNQINEIPQQVQYNDEWLRKKKIAKHRELKEQLLELDIQLTELGHGVTYNMGVENFRLTEEIRVKSLEVDGIKKRNKERESRDQINQMIETAISSDDPAVHKKCDAMIQEKFASNFSNFKGNHFLKDEDIPSVFDFLFNQKEDTLTDKCNYVRRNMLSLFPVLPTYATKRIS